MSKLLAQIESGNVQQVIVCGSIDWAQRKLGGNWIETKIDGSERARYAGIGYVYKPELDAFLPPQPAFNYSIDSETKNWIFPEGDHFYVPVDPRLIEGLSRGLYALIDPERPGLYAGIVYHPDNDQWPVLQFRKNDIVPIGLKSDSVPLQQVLSAFVQSGAMAQSDLDAIVSAVQAAAGASVRVKDFIPESWKNFVMSREQAEQAGYF